jgi:hypothetical protein
MDVDREMVDESLLCFGGAPRSSKESIEVCPEHRAGVIQREEGIKSDFLKLPLPDHTTPTAGRREVNGVRMATL